LYSGSNGSAHGGIHTVLPKRRACQQPAEPIGVVED
jgi:hypothetical protein